MSWEFSILNPVETSEKIAANSKRLAFHLELYSTYIFKESAEPDFKAHWAMLEQTVLDDTVHQLYGQWKAADSSVSLLPVMWTVVPPSASPQ